MQVCSSAARARGRILRAQRGLHKLRACGSQQGSAAHLQPPLQQPHGYTLWRGRHSGNHLPRQSLTQQIIQHYCNIKLLQCRCKTRREQSFSSNTCLLSGCSGSKRARRAGHCRSGVACIPGKRPVQLHCAVGGCARHCTCTFKPTGTPFVKLLCDSEEKGNPGPLEVSLLVARWPQPRSAGFCRVYSSKPVNTFARQSIQSVLQR